MEKVWNERKVGTDEQSITVRFNEMRDGVVLESSESDNSDSFRLYLTYKEALVVAEQIIGFVEYNQ